MDIGLKDSTFAFSLDGSIYLTLSLLHHLLDTGRVDAAVQDQLLQRQPGDLPADRVKAGYCDSLRRVVDDQVHPGQGLQGADIAAFAADDTALHLIVGQGHHGHRGLRHMVSSTALNGQGDDLTGLGVSLVLEAGLDFLDLHRRLVGHVGLQLAEEISFRLLCGKAGDLLQHIYLLLLEPFSLCLGGLQPGQAVGQMLLFPLHVLCLAVQVLFLLLKPAFLFLKVAPALLFLPLILIAGLEDLLLRLQKGLSLLIFCALVRVVDDLLRLVLCGVQILISLLPLPQNAEHIDQCRTQNQAQNRPDNIG